MLLYIMSYEALVLTPWVLGDHARGTSKSQRHLVGISIGMLLHPVPCLDVEGFHQGIAKQCSVLQLFIGLSLCFPCSVNKRKDKSMLLGVVEQEALDNQWCPNTCAMTHLPCCRSLSL